VTVEIATLTLRLVSAVGICDWFVVAIQTAAIRWNVLPTIRGQWNASGGHDR
jgi:hypothetical protein